MIAALVYAQAATFIALGAFKFIGGDWRQGAAQLMLAVITALVYL